MDKWKNKEVRELKHPVGTLYIESVGWKEEEKIIEISNMKERTERDVWGKTGKRDAINMWNNKNAYCKREIEKKQNELGEVQLFWEK